MTGHHVTHKTPLKTVVKAVSLMKQTVIMLAKYSLALNPPSGKSELR